MASLNTVRPMTSGATVAVASDADKTFKCVATPMLHARLHMNTSGWPVAITSSGAQCRHRGPRPLTRDPARNVGSDRMTWTEPHRLPRRVNSPSRGAHLSSVRRLPTQQRRFTRTGTHARNLGTPQSSTNLLMRSLSLAQHRTGPNPALKRNANSVARRPSSAGPCGPFCARCPTRHAVGIRLALR